METTMSAPTYFYPLERFVDGGVTTHNNPSLAAFVEALTYSSPNKASYYVFMIPGPASAGPFLCN